MNIRFVGTIAAFFLLFTSSVVFGQNGQQTKGFFDKKDEGWFFYNEELPKEEPEEEPEEEPKTIVSVPPEQSSEPAKEKPKYLSAEWLRINLDTYKDIALDNPTMENVSAYLYLQRYAMDKSEMFAEAVQMATIGNPYLDEETRRPQSSYGKNSIDHYATINQDNLLLKLAKSLGIFFYFSSDSVESVAQSSTLQAFANKYGFVIYPISIDGNPLPNGSFPDFKVDEGQSIIMDVKFLPSLYLVSNSGEYEPLAQNITTVSGMANRILITARRHGWITESEYAETKPIINSETNTVPMFESLIENIKKNKVERDEANFVDPKELTMKIKESLRANNPQR